MLAVVIMFAVAALCLAGSVVWFVRPVRSEAATYRHRIGATMLVAAGVILAGYAVALLSWTRDTAS